MNKRISLHRWKQSWISVFLLLFIQSCAFSQQEKKEVVCITKSGKKYHTENCGYLKDSSFQIDIKKAKEQGYTPCSVCKPGSVSNKSDTLKSVNTLLSHSNVAPVQKSQATTSQCSALTKTGLRCKRTTSDASGKCWQHQ